MALRSSDTSLVSSMFLATCCVIVDAPTGRRAPRFVMFWKAARAMSGRLTPGCVKNVLSSAARNALTTRRGIASNGTKVRRSMANSARMRPSAACTRVVTDVW